MNKIPNKILILRIIKYLAIIFLCLMLATEAYLMIVRPGDDIAGGVFMGLLGIAVSGIVASAAARFEHKIYGHNN